MQQFGWRFIPKPECHDFALLALCQYFNSIKEISTDDRRDTVFDNEGLRTKPSNLVRILSSHRNDGTVSYKTEYHTTSGWTTSRGVGHHV